MKIEIEASKQYVFSDGIVARIWRGKTDRGTKCVVVVTKIAIDINASQDEFDQLIDLQKTSLHVARSFEEVTLEEQN